MGVDQSERESLILSAGIIQKQFKPETREGIIFLFTSCKVMVYRYRWGSYNDAFYNTDHTLLRALIIEKRKVKCFPQKPPVQRVILACDVSVNVTVLTRQKAVLSTVEAVRLGVLLASLRRTVQVGMSVNLHCEDCTGWYECKASL